MRIVLLALALVGCGSTAPIDDDSTDAAISDSAVDGGCADATHGVCCACNGHDTNPWCACQTLDQQ